MVVNLSNSSSDFEKFKLMKSSFSTGEKLLDLTGTINGDSLFDIIDLKEVDKDFKIKSSAINEYVNYVGSLSRTYLGDKSIRKYQIRHLPVYWLTDISEKHPYYQPILNIFYFKNLILKDCIRTEKDEEFKVIIPSNSIHYLKNIEKFFEKVQCKVKVIYFEGDNKTTYTFRGYLSFLKQRRKEYLDTATKLKVKGSGTVDRKNLIFTTVPATWSKKLKRDYSLGGICDLSEGFEKNSGGYLPFFTSFADMAEWSGGFNHTYKTAFPSKTEFNLFLIIAALKYWKLSCIKCSDTTEGLINETGLKKELLRVYSEKFYLLFNYIWFLNFFKSIQKPSNIFYQDELYHPGRVISQAAMVSENKNVLAYGVQHGIIMPGHTVYKVTNEETETQTAKFDGFPLPAFFLVWGNYFETLVAQNSAKLAKRTKVAGNPNYISILKEQKTKISERINQNLNILWCTGLLRDVKKEYSLMKKILSENKNYNLTIRFHPQHNLRNDLNEMLDSVIMNKTKFSEGVDLFEDLRNSDVVVTCSASTVYIDGLVFGKPVFSIDTDNYYLDKVSFENLFSIKDKEEFEDYYGRLTSGKLFGKKEKNISELIYTKEDVWKDILAA